MSRSEPDFFPILEEADVRQQELEEEIQPRRSEAFSQLTESREQVADTLVGLALSGGGIRSGAFCLGALHAICQRRLLPFVDYLSTVSGGGYAGAYLTTEILRSTPPHQADPAQPRLPFDLEHTAFSEKVDRSAAGGTARPATEVARINKPFNLLHFVHGGKYLFKTWDFSSRHLIGWALIFGTVASGLVALSALTAWLFRLMDYPAVRRWLDQLGFNDDLRVAFFPAFVLLLLYLLTWLISYWKYGAAAPGDAARYVFYGLVTTTAIGVAGLLGTSHISFVDVTMAKPPDRGGSRAEQIKVRHASSEQVAVNDAKGKLIYIVATALAAALLPYLNPKRLFRSGTAPESGPVEKAIYAIATRALVFGIPFAIVAWFCRENISGFNQQRPALFAQSSEIADWDYARAPFWERLLTEKVVPFSPSGPIIERSNDPEKNICVRLLQVAGVVPKEAIPNFSSEPETASSPLEEALQRLKPLIRDYRQADNDLDPFEAWAMLIPAPFAGTNPARPAANGSNELSHNRLRNYVAIRTDIEDQKNGLVKYLNNALGDPTLYQAFEGAQGKSADRLADPVANAVQEQLRSDAVQSVIVEARRLYGWLWEFDARPGTHSASDDLSTAVAEAFDEDARSATNWCLLMVDVNRRLLEAYYGDALRSKRDFISSNVVIQADEQARLNWFGLATGIFFLFCLFVDLNATSWHGFYSNQIANMWMQAVPGLERQVPLAQMETTLKGGPYHLISGTVQMLGRRDQSSESLPQDHFLFSRRFFGSSRTGYAATTTYDDANLTLANSVAISGAAVSPSQTTNVLVRVLLFLANIRLGQWVVNPGQLSSMPRWVREWTARVPITPLRVLASLGQIADHRPFCFVTDGGHFENLGVEALIRRRCRLIIAIDSSQDETYLFADFDKLIRWARLTHGVEFLELEPPGGPLQLGPLCPQPVPEKSAPPAAPAPSSPAVPHADRIARLYSSQHFVVAEIRYPEPEIRSRGKSFLVYVKSSLTGDEPRDLIGFANIYREFPHDVTSDQAFEPERFEAYRQLGKHVTDAMISELFGNLQEFAKGPADLVNCLEKGPRVARSRGTTDVKKRIDRLADVRTDPLKRDQEARWLMHWLEAHPQDPIDVSPLLSVVLHEGDDRELANLAHDILVAGGVRCLDRLVWKNAEQAVVVAEILADIVDKQSLLNEPQGRELIAHSAQQIVQKLLALEAEAVQNTALRRALLRALKAYGRFSAEQNDRPLRRQITDALKRLTPIKP